MRYAIVGFGKMGRAVDAAAKARGHARAAVVDPARRPRGAATSIAAARLEAVDVAFEFTQPDAARRNVLDLLACGVSVVCGTTGWDAGAPEIDRALRSSRAGLIAAPNFSIGMGVFLRLASEAAAALGAAGGYDPWIVEMHHRGKRDAPSGTAERLAERIAGSRRPRAAIVRGLPDAPLAAGEVHVASVRAGREPGRHTVGFDGAYDRITLTHEAAGREGFAGGAVLAAEWLRGRRGRHGFDEVLDDLLRRSGGRGRGGGRR